MKRILFLFGILLISSPFFAKEVPLEQAELAAKNFLIQKMTRELKNASNIKLELIPSSTPNPFKQTAAKSTAQSKPLIYLFSINTDDGFILVSADDHALPILAYSLEGGADLSQLPINYLKWIEGYKSQIRYIRSNPDKAAPKVINEWEDLINGDASGSTKSTSSIAPLLSTQWNQSPYVNELCPYDANANEKTVTGCAATAMAQIMKFWNYPSQGSGYHGYSHDTYGSLSASFGSVSYDWSSMPDLVDAPNQAVATLMYHCGVSIEMDYGVPSQGGSGAYVISDRSPIQHCVEYALEQYFKYDPGLRGVIRDSYTTEAWIALLKSELDEGRPMEYAGFGSGGGHAFVCDGYDDYDFFHFNWGWGGYYDGYFSIDALDPAGTGIGGGSGGFNSGHQALIGISPPQEVSEYDLRLYSEATISENPLFYGDAFQIDCDVANYGSQNFTGDIGAAIFDGDENFIEFIEITENITLQGGFYNSVSFGNEGSLNLVPGDYFCSLFFRSAGGNWEAFADGSYNNRLAFDIFYSNDIELYSDFILNSGEVITQGQPLQITTEVANTGTGVFSGDLAIDLYTLEGDFVETVETISGVSMDAGYYYPVTFDSPGIDADPGTYLMALTHLPTGGSWVLSGSSYAANPTHVIVKAAPLGADMYEENNTSDFAYELSVLFSNNTATVQTPGANNHLGTDLDYYQLILEEGYSYTIEARAHDSYNSGKAESFTNDVIWAWATDGIWSEVYDDVMADNIQMERGGQIIFGVTPYFEGETGTYLLEMQITRSPNVSLETIEEDKINLYPNPASDILNIESSRLIDRVEIYDAKGRIMHTIDTSSANIQTDVSALQNGIYFIHIVQEDQTLIQKIIIQ